MLPTPTPLAPGHPADTPFFFLVYCWPFHDRKLTWADFAWATFPLSPFLGLWKCVGQGLVHRMDDQPGVGRDSFETGNKRELTECSLASLREMSVLAGDAAGLVWFLRPGRLGWKARGGNAISRKAMEGSCIVTAYGRDVTWFCFKYGMWWCLRLGGRFWTFQRAAVCGDLEGRTLHSSPLLWGCNTSILHESQDEFRWKLSVLSL